MMWEQKTPCQMKEGLTNLLELNAVFNAKARRKEGTCAEFKESAGSSLLLKSLLLQKWKCLATCCIVVFHRCAMRKVDRTELQIRDFPLAQQRGIRIAQQTSRTAQR
jgi:hypothetical protein